MRTGPPERSDLSRTPNPWISAHAPQLSRSRPLRLLRHPQRRLSGRRQRPHLQCRRRRAGARSARGRLRSPRLQSLRQLSQSDRRRRFLDQSVSAQYPGPRVRRRDRDGGGGDADLFRRPLLRRRRRLLRHPDGRGVGRQRRRVQSESQGLAPVRQRQYHDDRLRPGDRDLRLAALPGPDHDPVVLGQGGRQLFRRRAERAGGRQRRRQPERGDAGGGNLDLADLCDQCGAER